MQRLRILIVALGVFAMATIAFNTMAQDRPDGPPPQDGTGPDDGFGGPGGPGGPGGMRGQRGPGGGFHLLPQFVVANLKLTADQKKQIAALEKETKAKLYKILTADQKKTLEQARPPRPGQGGPGGDRPGQGFGRRGQGGRGGQGGPNGGPGGGPDGPGPDREPPPRPADE
jgi:hypothetical protein